MPMILHAKSHLTGNLNTMELPIEARELQAWLHATPQPLIQDAFPHLTPEQREFIMTGVTPQEWEAAFGQLEDDEIEWHDKLDGNH